MGIKSELFTLALGLGLEHHVFVIVSSRQMPSPSAEDEFESWLVRTSPASPRFSAELKLLLSEALV